MYEKLLSVELSELKLKYVYRKAAAYTKEPYCPSCLFQTSLNKIVFGAAYLLVWAVPMKTTEYILEIALPSRVVGEPRSNSRTFELQRWLIMNSFQFQFCVDLPRDTARRKKHPIGIAVLSWFVVFAFSWFSCYYELLLLLLELWSGVSASVVVLCSYLICMRLKWENMRNKKMSKYV